MLKFREEAIANIKEINEILPTKADKEDLLQLESKIADKFNELINQMYHQFADKAETRKKFA